MIPCSFAESNAVLDRPTNVSSEQCVALSVCNAALEDGTPVVISLWKCTADELKEIQRTGRVWLMVMGNTMPPVVVSGLKVLK